MDGVSLESSTVSMACFLRFHLRDTSYIHDVVHFLEVSFNLGTFSFRGYFTDNQNGLIHDQPGKDQRIAFEYNHVHQFEYTVTESENNFRRAKSKRYN